MQSKSIGKYESEIRFNSQAEKVIYVPQAVKNLFRVSRFLSKGATMGDTQDKMTINKNDVNIILDSRKGKNESMMFYLKANIYSPKGSKPQEIKTNLI